MQTVRSIWVSALSLVRSSAPGAMAVAAAAAAAASVVAGAVVRLRLAVEEAWLEPSYGPDGDPEGLHSAQFRVSGLGPPAILLLRDSTALFQAHVTGPILHSLVLSLPAVFHDPWPSSVTRCPSPIKLSHDALIFFIVTIISALCSFRSGGRLWFYVHCLHFSYSKSIRKKKEEKKEKKGKKEKKIK